MYHPTTRLLTILELLQARPALSGAELAARLEVDVRTVRRYITMLQDMGMPIEADRGRHGGYQLRPGYKLPPLMFTEDEAVALTLGLLITRRLGLGIDPVAEEGALAKVERVTPAPVRELVYALQENLVMEFPTDASDHSPQSMVVKALSLAVRRQQRVRLYYRAWDGQETGRDVDPYGLAYRAGFWYMVAHCHLRKGLRTFRLDRVLDVTPGEQTFERPVAIDILRHVEAAIAQTPGTWRVDILLRATLEHVQSLIPPTVGAFTEEEGGVALRCHVQHLGWFASNMARLDCPVVVRHPPELRDELRSIAARLSRYAAAMPEPEV
jgi:predicted DNA-binding transcriptional regulator YafY